MNLEFSCKSMFPRKNHGKRKNCIFKPRKIFSKCSSGHLNFGFHTLVENVRQRTEFLHSKSANRVKTIFFERTFLSQSVFLDTWNAVLTNLLKLFRQETATFPSVPKRQKSLVCDKFFCSKCSSVHVECLPGSSRFYLKCLWTSSCQFDTTSWYFSQESGTLPLKDGKRIWSCFSWNKNHSTPKASPITWTALLAILSKLFSQ